MGGIISHTNNIFASSDDGVKPNPILIYDKSNFKTERNLFIDSNLTPQKYETLLTLDLSGTDIDDEYIKLLSKNDKLSGVLNINLENNPKITIDSLHYLYDSIFFGIRRRFENENNTIYDRYGCASSHLYVYIKNTSITHENIKNSKICEKLQKNWTHLTMSNDYSDTEVKTVKIGLRSLSVNYGM